MKSFFAAILFGALVILIGCNQGTSGGPGATTPSSKKPMAGQTEDTFSLVMPSAKLNQGETKTVSVGINRGKNFSQDVSLKLADLPKGVNSDPASPVIKHGDTEAKITLKAAGDAALGDFHRQSGRTPDEGRRRRGRAENLRRETGAQQRGKYDLRRRQGEVGRIHHRDAEAVGPIRREVRGVEGTRRQGRGASQEGPRSEARRSEDEAGRGRQQARRVEIGRR